MSRPRGDLVYINRTKPVDVCITGHEDHEDHEVYREYVFVCLTIGKKHTKSVYKYYISGEYDLSDVSGSYKAGRFLFYSDHERRQRRPELYAVAEEAARSLSTPGENVERLYLQRREGYEPGEFLY